MFSERKETKTEGPSLNPFYTIPGELSKPFKVEIDTYSAELIRKGDSNALNLHDNEVKASLGQRYVMVAFIKDNIAHLRAIPGFDFVENVSGRRILAEKAAAFFQCEINDVAFPNHHIWTGVVHEQLISQITKKEPELVKNAEIVAFSMIKKGDRYHWLNRSARNTHVFIHDPLACACFLFEEKSNYTDYKPPKFDLFYHLVRSIPKDFFINLTNGATEVICSDDYFPLANSVLDECTNFPYEAKWKEIQKLYETDKPKAVAKIQYMLVRNLHIYLSKLNAPDDRDRARDYIKAGFVAADAHDILIDIDFVPPEFEGHLTASSKMELKWDEINEFIKFYKISCFYRTFSIALREENLAEIKRLLDKIKEFERDTFLKAIIKASLAERKLEVINGVYDQCLINKIEQRLCYFMCAQYQAAIFKGSWEEAKICFQWLTAKKVPQAFFQASFKVTYIEDMFLLHFGEVLLEDKPDFNKKNKNGDTLLFLAVYLHDQGSVVEKLLKHNADPNLLGQFGETILECAFGKGCYNTLLTLLQSGAKFPDYFADDSYAAERLSQDMIKWVDFSLKAGDADLGLAVVKKTIKAQNNIKMEAKFLNVLFTLFESYLFEAFDNVLAQTRLLKLLQFTDISGQDKVIFHQAKVLAMLDDFLEYVPDKKMQLALINAVLDSKSVIGQMLLKTTSPSGFFGYTLVVLVENFRKKLSDLKESLSSVPQSEFKP